MEVWAPCSRVKWLLIILTLFFATAANAQNPDVQVKADVVPTYSWEMGQHSAFRFYDELAHYSTVALSVTLEPGLHAYISERLERIDNNADPEQLDEYYVEERGIWRVGKQYLPFGKLNLLREDAKAARGDTRFLFAVPISLAVCDNGSGQARGVVGRVGSVVGLSFAYGRNFAAQSTDLALVHHPENALGNGRGYGLILGVDGARHLGRFTAQAEAIMLRKGETRLDKDTEVSDIALSLQPTPGLTITGGWSREWEQRANFFRLQGRLRVAENATLEPLVRMRDSRLFDFGMTLHVRL